MLSSKLRRKIKDIRAKLTVRPMRQKILPALKTTTQKTLLFTSVFVMSMSTLSVLPLNSLVHAAGAYQLTGRVVDQSGNGVENVSVTANDPSTAELRFGPAITDTDGSYTLSIDAGIYNIRFAPSGGSGLSLAVENNYELSASQTLNIQLVPTHKFTSKVTDQDNNAIPNLTIATGGGSVKTGPAGEVSATFSAGVYGVHFYNWTPDTSIASSKLALFHIGSINNIDLTTGDVTQNYEITLRKLTVKVKNSDGTPQAGAKITSRNPGSGVTHVESNTGSYSPLVDSVGFGTWYAPITTDDSGTATILAPQGTSFEANYICADLTDGTNFCYSNATDITNDTTIELTKPVSHTFTSTFTDQNNNALSNMRVDLDGNLVPTDSTGHISSSYPASVYGLRLYNFYFNTLVNGEALSYFRLGKIADIDLSNNDVHQDFALNLSRLNISVKNGDGTPNTNANIYSINTGYGTTTFNSGANNYSSVIDAAAFGRRDGVSTGTIKTNGEGVATVLVPRGTIFDPNNICARHTDGSEACYTNTVNASADTMIEITKSTTHTFSTTITDQNNNALPNVKVDLDGNLVPTDPAGYAMSAYSAGLYPLQIHNNNTYATIINGNILANFHISKITDIDLSNNDVHQDFSLNLGKLIIETRDSNGYPEPGAKIVSRNSGSGTTTVSSNANTYTTTVDNVHFGTYTDTTTDNNGRASVLIPKGTTFGPNYGICATFTDGTESCSQSSITVSDEVTLVFQKAPPLPSIPTNLNATSPAQNPVLTWTAVPGATSYNIYRNGERIDSTNNASYADNTAPEGTDAYYVTAVNTTGESGASSSVTAVVDRTKPNITATVTPSQVNGWNNSEPVTVSFNCTDDRSGIESCTDSIEVPHGDGSYTVTGTAVDKAGNTNSVTVPILVDTTAPTITETHTPANANANNWYSTDVTTTFTCTDNANAYQSGAASCSPSVTLNTDGANQSVTGTATDVAGNSSTKTVTYNIDKTAPEIEASLSAAQTNGWNNGPVTVTFGCTDATSGVDSCTSPVTLSQDGIYIVTGTAVDKAGNITEINVTIQIDSTLPTVTNAAFTVNPKLTTDASATLTADVADLLSNSSASGLASVEYFDPVQQAWLPMTLNGSTATVSFDTPTDTYAAGTYTFQVRATDNAGNVSTPATASLLIKNPNQAPVISPLVGGTITEGGAYNENGTYNDPESTLWTATVDYGDGSGVQNLPLSGNNFALGHVYQDEGTYTVTVSITDDEGATATSTMNVIVNNAAASTSPITTSSNLILLGSPITASTTFADPGSTDTHTAVWNWGDGTTSAGTLTENNGAGSVSNNHTYTATGVYTITLTITDNDGAVSVQKFNYVAVYDHGKFVGGDNFNSPIGASTAAPWLGGMATFGITANIDAQGQLTADVRMDFDAGNIHLYSNTPTSLVTTADGYATLRGSGSVNGVSDFTYLVTGFDGKKTGQADAIRFQIKDPSGQVIYDTQMNDADTETPSTPLLNPGNGNNRDNLIVTLH